MAEQEVILITGASSGIGAAAARLLAAQGHHVVLGARSKGRLAALVTEILAAGGSAEYHVLDVTDADDVQTFVLAAWHRHGRLDVLVNAAGAMPLSRLEALKLHEWDRMLDVNVRGVMYGIAAVLPLMQRAGGGHVINLAPDGAAGVGPAAAVYAATGAAVRGLSAGLRAEEEAIRVTVLAPAPPDDVPGAALTRAANDGAAPGPGGTMAVARAIARAIAQSGGKSRHAVMVAEPAPREHDRHGLHGGADEERGTDAPVRCRQVADFAQ